MESPRFGHAERKSLFMARPTNSIPGATRITGRLLVKRVNGRERTGEQLSSCSFCEPGNEPGHPRDTRPEAAWGRMRFLGACMGAIRFLAHPSLAALPKPLIGFERIL